MNEKKVKRRPSMIGNQNSVKEIIKDDRVLVRLYHEDKLKLKKYCQDNGISQADFLINSMVDQGILPTHRRIETKMKKQED